MRLITALSLDSAETRTPGNMASSSTEKTHQTEPLAYTGAWGTAP